MMGRHQSDPSAKNEIKRLKMGNISIVNNPAETRNTDAKRPTAGGGCLWLGSQQSRNVTPTFISFLSFLPIVLDYTFGSS
jgi:hypothetical protein